VRGYFRFPPGCFMIRTVQTGIRGCGYLFALLIAAIAPSRAQTLELKNDHVIARFDSRGLVSLQNLDSHKTVSFRSDNLSLTIDEATFDSGKLLPVPMADVGPHKVAFILSADGYRIEVTYELQPTWSFVSKQIRVITAPKKNFIVHRVEPIRAQFGEPINSSFIPGTYYPHFGETREQSRADSTTNDYGAFLRLLNNTGVMLLAQNPFLKATITGDSASLEYKPEIDWNSDWGVFSSDTACIGVYSLTGDRLPAEMILEWKPVSAPEKHDGADRAEISAFTECVRAFLVNSARDPISVEVGWTLNDYQIDVATAEGRAEYKRVMDTTASLGIRNLLYAPTNSALALKANDTDDWDWEHVLWLGLGQKIRTGKWNPESDAIPPAITEMIDYAKSKQIGLLAYVYPSLPFVQNPNWIVTKPEKKTRNAYSTLASREFQDFLIRELLVFKRRTGIAGFAFDYAFLNLPGSSSYAQWLGWRRVMETLRREEPNIVIDGRQSYQTYGPWSWLAGSYPHPTGTDEQPESFTPFPDLHFDRVSADRERFVDYWYRNYQFAPEEVIPGYMTHQTERSRNIAVTKDGVTREEEEMMDTTFRQRDWDYLGFRYSVISSIATGGWNNVMNMIPGRDLAEFQNFSERDKKWIRDWIAWTTDHKEFLRHTQPILGQPALGKVDGTSAILNDRGYIFLFNPNYKQLDAKFTLNRIIGLRSGKNFILRELYPRPGNTIGAPGAGVWRYGAEVSLPMHGTTAMVFEIEPFDNVESAPVVYNAGERATARLNEGALNIEHASGEPGTENEIGVLLPTDAKVLALTLSGAKSNFTQYGRYILINAKFGGAQFTQAQQVALKSADDGSLAGSFTIPARIHAQLNQREADWPIPWTGEDYSTTWLAPQRLLLFLQFAEPSGNLNPTLTIDGHEVELKKAYSSVREHAESLVGFYADVTSLAADTLHRVVLKIPSQSTSRFQGAFFDNVEPQFTESIAVQRARSNNTHH
jgi:hypothetical protein